MGKSQNNGGGGGRGIRRYMQEAEAAKALKARRDAEEANRIVTRKARKARKPRRTVQRGNRMSHRKMFDAEAKLQAPDINWAIFSSRLDGLGGAIRASFCLNSETLKALQNVPAIFGRLSDDGKVAIAHSSLLLAQGDQLKALGRQLRIVQADLKQP